MLSAAIASASRGSRARAREASAARPSGVPGARGQAPASPSAAARASRPGGMPGRRTCAPKPQIAAAARVKSHLEPLKQVKVRSLRHELTPAIQELHTQRKQSLMSLQGQIHSLTLSTVPEERQAANVLDIWLGKHRGQLLSMGYTPLTEHINEIIADAETDANVSGALVALSLMPIVEKLKAINEEFKTLSLQRRDELSQTEKVY